MRSPFPGMDPFIESCGLWGDFHHDLISEIKASLASAAPDRYLVRTGERSYLVLVEDDGKTSHPFLPDISVAAPVKTKKSNKKKGSVAVADIVDDGVITMRAFIEEEHRESFVEIFETTPEQRLITCIEILSPSNKRPGTPGWESYLRKRQSLMLAGVNLVEIDLLRGGQRMPMLDPWPNCPYTFMVAKANKAQACRVWPLHLQKPLPPLPVPLARPDPDIELDLQSMVNSIYERSRYARSIDYTKPATPKLTGKEAAWLKTLLDAQR